MEDCAIMKVKTKTEKRNLGETIKKDFYKIAEKC